MADCAIALFAGLGGSRAVFERRSGICEAREYACLARVLGRARFEVALSGSWRTLASSIADESDERFDYGAVRGFAIVGCLKE